MFITKQNQEDLLVTALEGGSNYWYYLPDLSMLPESTKGEPTSIRIFKAVQDGAEIPVHDYETNEKLGMLTKKGMNSVGKQMFDKGYKEHMADILNEQWDGITADVFFQLAVMNEIVFG